MAPKITYYKNADISSIELTVPEKVKGRYFSYLSNKNGPMYIQTPTLNVVPVDEKTIRFKLKNEGQFEKLLNDFDQYVIDYISERTVQFFRGSHFSKGKIESSYVATTNNEGYFDVHVADVNNLIIKDQRDAVRKFEEIESGTEAIAILNVEGVSFTKKTIKLSLSLSQLKIYVKEQLVDWCILHDSDSEVEEEDPEEAAAVALALEAAKLSTSPSITKVSPEGSNTIGGDLITVPQTVEDKENDDEKDLF